MVHIYAPLGKVVYNFMCIKWYIYDPLGESDLIFVYMMHIIHAFLTCNHLYLIKQRLFALENDFLPFLR